MVRHGRPTVKHFNNGKIPVSREGRSLRSLTRARATRPRKHSKPLHFRPLQFLNKLLPLHFLVNLGSMSYFKVSSFQVHDIFIEGGKIPSIAVIYRSPGIHGCKDFWSLIWPIDANRIIKWELLIKYLNEYILLYFYIDIGTVIDCC